VPAPQGEPVPELLKAHGLRMTPQRRAIVAEIMAADGHITPSALAQRVRQRVPGVDPSTVYRTLDLLEQLGVLSHTHMESGAGYHRRAEAQHVHLTCSRCGSEDSLTLAEAKRLKDLVARHRGFEPDLTHFAISGLCAACKRGRARGPA
jgi:Fur family ferric uptake transcriptional regulator